SRSETQRLNRRRRATRPRPAAPSMAAGGSGTTESPGTWGSVSDVPYWNVTLLIIEAGSKPIGRPPSVKTTWFLISSFPVTPPLPVAGLSPALVIPNWRPSGLSGPDRFGPGKRSADPKRPRPVDE